MKLVTRIPHAAAVAAAALLAAACADAEQPLAPVLGPDAYLSIDDTTLTEPIILEPVPTGPLVFEGRLVFPSQKAFDDYVGALPTAESALAQKESSFGGFTSLRAYLADEVVGTSADGGSTSLRTLEGPRVPGIGGPQLLTQEPISIIGQEPDPTEPIILEPVEDDTELVLSEYDALEVDGVTREDFLVSDEFLSTLNADGEVQIAGVLYKVTRDWVLEADPADSTMLRSVAPTLSSDPNEALSASRTSTSIGVHAVETVSSDMSANELAAMDEFGVTAQAMSTCRRYSGTTRRMEGKSYINNYWFYSEAGVRTNWERKRKFLWWSWWSRYWQSGTLSAQYNATISEGLWDNSVPPISTSYTGTRSVSSGSTAFRRLDWMVGWGVKLRGTISATHSVSNSSLNASCTTSVTVN